jgi:hypothetical protein
MIKTDSIVDKLCMIHCTIRVVQQGATVSTIFWIQADADAGSDLKILFPQFEWLGKNCLDLPIVYDVGLE